MLDQQVGTSSTKTVNDPIAIALNKATQNLISLQSARGDWEGEMVWNTMLLAHYVLVHRIVGGKLSFDERQRDAMILHFTHWQRPDGGWGMHPESPSYVYFTVMAYIALRVLGLGARDPRLARARSFLRQPGTGGVLAIPSWGKLWLSMLGLYKWEGCNPIPPEVFLLPESLPFHPNNYYCHTRYIYLGIAYLYGSRFVADLGPLRDDLRDELYDQPYHEVKFSTARHQIAESDLYVRPSAPLRFAWDLLAQYERFAIPALRKRALQHCLDRIIFEQGASRGQGISPVNGLLNCLALFAADPQHPLLQSGLAAMDAWKWQDDAEGIRYAGARSNAWDTAFAMQALAELPDTAPAATAIRRGYAFLRATQMTEELPGWREERRERILGGWCFSDGEHRWAVSDCTAEALVAIGEAHADRQVAPAENEQVSDERILQAVEFMLRRQNDDGGFGTYEKRRGGPLLELVNPSEMYGQCMTELSYIECTASCVVALANIRRSHPQMLPHQVTAAIELAVTFLRAQQRPDGSYLGFWGVNFTYAGFHIAEALTAVGTPATDPALSKLADWLVAHQKTDGSWGEHYTSCLDGKYKEHDEGQAVMTSWALLALLKLRAPSDASIRRGIQWLVARQSPNGSWPQEALAGVFFGTAMLDYKYYKEYFPTWALARYAKLAART